MGWLIFLGYVVVAFLSTLLLARLHLTMERMYFPNKAQHYVDSETYMLAAGLSFFWPITVPICSLSVLADWLIRKVESFRPSDGLMYWVNKVVGGDV